MADIDFELLSPTARQANDAVLVRRGASAPNTGALIAASDLGVSDGDKGDITVSSSGTVWAVDDEVKYGYAVAASQGIGMF